MIFIFRAAFWIAVVAAFVPVGFTAPSDGAFARNAEILANSAFNGELTGGMKAEGVCEGREDVCQVAGEFTSFAGWAAGMAAQRLDRAVETHLRSDEAATIAQGRAEADAVFAAAAQAPTR